jgi:hypothetical protein
MKILSNNFSMTKEKKAEIQQTDSGPGETKDTGKDKKINEIEEFFKKYSLRITDEIKEEPVCFKFKDEEQSSVFGTLGNISTLIGKAKARKTTAAALFVANALTNENKNYINADFPEDKRTCIYIDTEQGKFHAQKNLNRIIRLARLPLEKQPENLYYFTLRPLSPDQRIKAIEFMINKIPNIGLLIIDGVRDLVSSINDENESTKVLQYLLKWSEIKQIHIINILHQNKGNEDARGHLGTELVNKSESVIEVLKDEDFSIIKPKSVRDIEFKPFAFYINSIGLPEAAEDYSPNQPPAEKTPKVDELTKDELSEITEFIFENGNSYNYKIIIDRLDKALKEKLKYHFGHNKVVKTLTRLRKESFVMNKAGQWHPYTKDPTLL